MGDYEEELDFDHLADEIEHDTLVELSEESMRIHTSKRTVYNNNNNQYGFVGSSKSLVFKDISQYPELREIKERLDFNLTALKQAARRAGYPINSAETRLTPCINELQWPTKQFKASLITYIKKIKPPRRGGKKTNKNIRNKNKSTRKSKQ